MQTNVDGIYLTSGYLNNEDVSSTIFNGLSYPKGILGKRFVYDDVTALKFSKTSVGTLYNGIYQVVQFKSGSTAANARGGALCWSDRANFIVTPDQTATTEDDFAGVGLMVNTKGNFGIMQVAGKCSILYRASVTDKTLGNLVLQLTTTNTFDALADSAGSFIAGGVKGLKSVVGIASVLPVDGTVTVAQIKDLNPNFG